MQTSESAITPAQHTQMMKALIDRPMNVIFHLERKSQIPTPQEVLDAVCKVRVFDDEILRLFTQVRDFYPNVEAAAAEATPERRSSIDTIEAAITGKPMAEVLVFLALEQTRNEELAPGLAVARDALLDGADTIYSPDYAPGEWLWGGKSVDEVSPGIGVGVADAVGVLAGVPLGPLGMGAGLAAGSGAALITVAVVEAIF